MRSLIICFMIASFSYGKTIAFLNFSDKTEDRKGKERLELIISSIFPNERFNLISNDEVNKVLTPVIQKELGTITPEIAWTIGELLGCDVIGGGSISGSPLKQLIRFFFIETKTKKDKDLPSYILDAFLSYFGINTKIEKLISQSELVISLGKEDGVKIGDRFDCIRDGKKIGELEVVSLEPHRSYLSVLSVKEKISPFDLIRESPFEFTRTNEFLIINTRPNADILWNGKNIGESPIAVNDKISGELSISKLAFEPLKIKIEEETYPDSLLSLSLFLATLKRAEKPLSLSVSSLPNNCEVFLDGRFIGLTPLFIPNLDEKVYEVVVKKEGFSPQLEKILLKQDRELKVNLYPVSLKEEVPILSKEKAYLSELISLPTSHSLKRGKLELGLVYPELFKLRVGLPSALKAEIRVFGIGCGLKYSIIEHLGIDFYYKAYDMENKEKQKEKGFWFIGSFDNKFSNIHFGLGQSFQEGSSEGQYFVGMDIPTKWITLLAEYEKDRFSIGVKTEAKGFEVKTAIGRRKNNTIYNLGIYLRK